MRERMVPLRSRRRSVNLSLSEESRHDKPMNGQRREESCSIVGSLTSNHPFRSQHELLPETPLILDAIRLIVLIHSLP